MRIKPFRDIRFQREGLKKEKNDTYHIRQGYSVLWDDEGDVKSGFDSWFIPARKSSTCVRGLERVRDVERDGDSEKGREDSGLEWVAVIQTRAGMYAPYSVIFSFSF